MRASWNFPIGSINHSKYPVGSIHTLQLETINFDNPRFKRTQHRWLVVLYLVQTFSSDTCCIIPEKCWKQSNLKNFQLEAPIIQYFLVESNKLWDWSFKSISGMRASWNFPIGSINHLKYPAGSIHTKQRFFSWK